MGSQSNNLSHEREKANSQASLESMLQRLMALPATPDSGKTLAPTHGGAPAWKPSSSTWGPLADVWNNSSQPKTNSLIPGRDLIYSEVEGGGGLESGTITPGGPQNLQINVVTPSIRDDESTKLIIFGPRAPRSFLAMRHGWVVLAGVAMWAVACWLALGRPGFEQVAQFR